MLNAFDQETTFLKFLLHFTNKLSIPDQQAFAAGFLKLYKVTLLLYTRICLAPECLK